MIKLGRRGTILLSLLAVVFILACSVISAPATSNPPLFDPTKVALEFQATAMSLQLTQSALNAQQNSQQPAQPTPAPVQPTAAIATVAPPPTEVPATATEDLEARMKSAKILVYENTDERGIGMWIQDALDGLGLTYTQTTSYSGHFFENLNSGIDWDLIIVGAEDKDAITGEFWDAIHQRLIRDKTALIVEIWYLDHEANGPINKVMTGCGIRYNTDWDLADSLYWWEPTHPIFNEPNVVMPLLHYNRYWSSQAGDLIQLGSGGDATLLSGPSSRKSSTGAVLASCYEGRVIFQTFSNHDYNQNDIVPLWENYIYYTLRNHFAATP